MADRISIIHKDAAKGDYQTIQAWAASTDVTTNDREIGVICDNAEYLSNDVTIAAGTGTPTLSSYLWLTVNDGVIVTEDRLANPLSSVRHDGTSGSGARLRSTLAGAHALILDSAYCRISNLEIYMSQNGGSSNECIRVNDGSHFALVENSILWTDKTRSDADGVYTGNSNVDLITVVNCIIFGMDRAGVHLQNSSITDREAHAEVFHCAGFNIGKTGEASTGFVRITQAGTGSIHSATIYNNWAAGAEGVTKEYSDGDAHTTDGTPAASCTWNGSYNAHQSGLTQIDGTDNTTNWTAATAFDDTDPATGTPIVVTNLTSGSEDVTPQDVAGNILIEGGDDLANITPSDTRVDLTVDMLGNTRPNASPDLGPIQVSAATGSAARQVAFVVATLSAEALVAVAGQAARTVDPVVAALSAETVGATISIAARTVDPVTTNIASETVSAIIGVAPRTVDPVGATFVVGAVTAAATGSAARQVAFVVATLSAEALVAVAGQAARTVDPVVAALSAETVERVPANPLTRSVFPAEVAIVPGSVIAVPANSVAPRTVDPVVAVLSAEALVAVAGQAVRTVDPVVAVLSAEALVAVAGQAVRTVDPVVAALLAETVTVAPIQASARTVAAIVATFTAGAVTASAGMHFRTVDPVIVVVSANVVETNDLPNVRVEPVLATLEPVKIRRASPLMLRTSHPVMLTFPDATPNADPDAADRTSGKIWLYSRQDEPISAEAGAVASAPNGGALAVAAGGVVHEWSNELVNTSYTNGDQVIASYVTPELWANAGVTQLPLDHVVVDGFDGTYYVWQVSYKPVTGPAVNVTGYGQIDASLDYDAVGSVGPSQGPGLPLPVLSDALNANTLQSGHVQGLINALIARHEAITELQATTNVVATDPLGPRQTPTDAGLAADASLVGKMFYYPAKKDGPIGEQRSGRMFYVTELPDGTFAWKAV